MLLLALLFVICLQSAAGQPIQCDPSCSKWGRFLAGVGAAVGMIQVSSSQPCAPRAGNCNLETGKCQCRWGRLGDNCEVDALPACRLTPEHPREARRRGLPWDWEGSGGPALLRLCGKAGQSSRGLAATKE